jgi:hypothetical protein
MARTPSTLAAPVTISIAFVRGMLSGVRSHGLSCDVFLADAGIAPELLEHASARVTAEQYVALFQSLTDRLGDDLLGFLKRPLRRGSLALVVRSAAGEMTWSPRCTRRADLPDCCKRTWLGGALRSLAGTALRFSDPSIAAPIFLHELILRALWRLFAWLGGKLPVVRLRFRAGHAGSGRSSPHRPVRPQSAVRRYVAATGAGDTLRHSSPTPGPTSLCPAQR